MMIAMNENLNVVEEFSEVMRNRIYYEASFCPTLTLANHTFDAVTPQRKECIVTTQALL